MDRGLQDAKHLLKSIVISSPHGMTVEKLNKDYRDTVGCYIPYARLGFSNLELFLKSLTDTLQVYGSGPTAKVAAICDNKTQHLEEMISRQKNTTRDRRNLSARSNMPQRTAPTPPLLPLSSVVTISKPPVYFNAQYNKQIYHPQLHTWVTVPCTTYYNYSHYTTPNDNYHWNIPPTQLQKQITSMHNNLNFNRLQISTPNSARQTHTPESRNHNYQLAQSPKPHPNISSNQRTSPTKVQPQKTECPKQEFNKPKSTSDSKQKETVKEMETPWFEEPKKQPDSAPKTFLNANENKYAKEIEASWFEETKKQADLVPKKCLNANGNESVKEIGKPKNRRDLAPKKFSNANGNKSVKEKEAFWFEKPTKQSDLAPMKFSNANGNKAAKEMEALWFEKPEKRLDLDPKKFLNINGQKSSNSRSEETSESSGSTIAALRNISTDFNETRESNEDKNKCKLLDNEAIPELAHNDIIFLLDYPAGSVIFGQKIPPSKIPDTIVKNSWFGLFVSEVHNPYKFWFHQFKENNELDSLMQDMENFYEKLSLNELQIQVSNIKPGQICCAPYLRMWHRCEILENPVGEEVKVFFVDYGTVSNIPITDIKYLLHEYSTLRCQALRGCLAYVKPKTHRWSRDATYAFLDMVNELLLYGKAIDIDEKERTVRMILTDTHDDRDFQINDALIYKGHAKYFDEDYNRSLQDEPLTPKERHFQEKYPTFDMLESGEYPSFQDIGILLAKGIDFEARQDENILPDVDENCSLEEITKELTTFNILCVASPDLKVENVDEISKTPDSENESNEIEEVSVESETEARVVSNKQALNPCTNPFIPQKKSSPNAENVTPNQLAIVPQYNQLVPMPSHQLQPNPFSINPFNMPMIPNNMQYYNSPSFYDAISMPAVQTIPVQTGPVYTSSIQFTNAPNIFNPAPEWAQHHHQKRNVTNVPPGFENRVSAKNLFYFR